MSSSDNQRIGTTSGLDLSFHSDHLIQFQRISRCPPWQPMGTHGNTIQETAIGCGALCGKTCEVTNGNATTILEFKKPQLVVVASVERNVKPSTAMQYPSFKAMP